MKEEIISVVKNLEAKGYKVKYYNDIEKAKIDIIDNVKLDETVGIGGSMTIFDMKIYEDLVKKGIEVYWHWMVSDDEKNHVRNEARNSDIYLTSSNAITEDGKLVNMDGVGNRVASMFYGHKKVFIVVGTNKICKNYEEAQKRIKTIAGPKNAKRLKLNTPCAITGECIDCNSPSRICNVEVILHNKPSNASITIFFIDEELGY